MASPNRRKSAKPGTIPYAAERLAVTRPTVYRLIESGHLKTYKIGRAHRTTDEAINACIARLMQENAERRAAA